MHVRHWTSEEVMCVLDHVEDHKGPDGLYMNQRKIAFENAKLALDCKVPGNGRTVERVGNKLSKIHGRWVKKGRSLYLSGWDALDGKYSRKAILSGITKNRLGDSPNEQLGSPPEGSKAREQRVAATDHETEDPKIIR